MKIKIPSKRSKKSGIELYFVLYISIIVSFLTIEAELKNYIKSQDDILLEVAQKEIQNLVEIESNSSDDMNNELKYSVAFKGDYDRENFKSEIYFYVDSLNEKGDPVFEISKKLNEEDNFYSANIPFDDFDTYLRKPLLTKIKMNFMPQISQDTKNNWSESFGSEKVVDKIIENIFERVEKEGSFELVKNIDTPLVPKPGVSENFEIVFDRNEYPVIKDIPFELAFINTGIDRTQDFFVDVVKGKSMIKEVKLNSTKSFIRGVASNNGVISLRGVRKIDDKISQTEIAIKAFEPQWESKTNTNETYIGEEFEFDARIKEISQRLITATIKSNLLPSGQLSIKSPYIKLPAFKAPGSLELSVFVDGNEVKGLKTVLAVKTPPPPEINFLREPNSNNIKLVVTVFGKTNSVDIIRPRSGIEGLSKTPEIQRLVNRKIFSYNARIKKPSEMTINDKEIKIYVRDKFGEKTDFQRIVKFLY